MPMKVITKTNTIISINSYTNKVLYIQYNPSAYISIITSE